MTVRFTVLLAALLALTLVFGCRPASSAALPPEPTLPAAAALPCPLFPADNVWNTRIDTPVSYTHLDVYKRQTLACLNCRQIGK